MESLKQLDKDPSYAEHEEIVRRKWSSENTHLTLLSDLEATGSVFSSCDGPPFQTGSPHHGHSLISYAKSIVMFFKMMHGMRPNIRGGFDTMGVPLEMIVNKLLNIANKDDIEKIGIAKYNQTCRDYINGASTEWEKFFDHLGRWVDFNDIYLTMDKTYMESVWWAVSELYKKGLVYKGTRVLPFSPATETAYSASEASQCYKDVNCRTVYIYFPFVDDENTGFVAYTTTSWTLYSNVALCVNPDANYVKVFDGTRTYIVAENCVDNLALKNIVSVTFYKKGRELVGQRYVPIYNFLNDVFSDHRVVCDNFVQPRQYEHDVGVVHLSPCHGEIDANVCLEQNIVTHDQIRNLCQVKDNGTYTEKIKSFENLLVTSKEADNAIVINLKEQKRLLRSNVISHSAAHCWRTDAPLIYKTVDSIFVKVTEIKDRMVELNEQINWVPQHIKEGRFGKWLENARDWNIGRSRVWGTPIPMWCSENGEEVVVVGSIQELRELSGQPDLELPHLHREYVDDILIPSKHGNGMLRRVKDVADCWLESGSAIFAQHHYPFENRELIDNDSECLTDFICEGLDQTRGWFYTLMVLSTALFDKPAFKNVICSGLICAADGKKLSKRLGNYNPPLETIEKYGADYVRLYMLGSPAVQADTLCFNEADIEKTKKKVIPYINAVSFLIEHCLNFQAKGNTFQKDLYKTSSNTMDRWIISRTCTLLKTVTGAMDKYELDTATNAILDYIDDLTNWYVKFNRDRLKGHDGVEEQSYALSTLNFVLYQYCLISAPFTPFLSEHIYNHLSKLQGEQLYTVFKASYPVESSFASEPEVERRMKRLQQVAYAVRYLRGKEPKFFSMKVPLSKVIVGHSSLEYLQDVQLVSQLIQEEVNCISFEIQQVKNAASYIVVFNQKNMGKKFRNDNKKIQEVVLGLPNTKLEEFLQTGHLLVQIENMTHHLDSTDAEVKLAPNEIKGENIQNYTEGELIVAIDTTYNQEIINMHLVRLFITNVQRLRKATDLHPWNPIAVYFDGTGICQLLEDNKVFIKERLACSSVEHISKRAEYSDIPNYADENLVLTDDVTVPVCIVRLDYKVAVQQQSVQVNQANNTC